MVRNGPIGKRVHKNERAKQDSSRPNSLPSLTFVVHVGPSSRFPILPLPFPSIADVLVGPAPAPSPAFRGSVAAFLSSIPSAQQLAVVLNGQRGTSAIVSHHDGLPTPMKAVSVIAAAPAAAAATASLAHVAARTDIPMEVK